MYVYVSNMTQTGLSFSKTGSINLLFLWFRLLLYASCPIPSHYLSISHSRRALVLSINNFYIPVDVGASLNDPLDSSVCIVEMAIFSYLSRGVKHQQ